jgi:mercuric ion transport protein
MQKIISFLLLVILFSACQNRQPSNTGSSTNSESIKFSPENLTEIRFDVRGMSCTNCENTICKSVKELPGIAEIKASYLDSFALVKFDKTKTNTQLIKQAIESKGYEVKGFTELKN